MQNETDGAYHLLPVHDVGGEPCWLVRSSNPRVGLTQVMKTRVDVFARWYDLDASAWRVDHTHISIVEKALGATGHAPCRSCARGSCEDWDFGSLEFEGYTVRERGNSAWRKADDIPGKPAVNVAEHAAFLGVAAPYTKDGIQASFRKKALQVHPDKGGDAAEMRRAIEARDVLLASLGPGKLEATRLEDARAQWKQAKSADRRAQRDTRGRRGKSRR